MHNGQILPLICDSAFCAEGGWRTTSVVILGHRSVAVPFTWRRKRCESQPQVQAHGAHPEAQTSWGPTGGANVAVALHGV